VTTTLRVALAGCGTVGGALVDLVSHSAREIAWRTGVRIEIVRVLVRDLRRLRGPNVQREIVTDDVDDFLASPADVVVEATGDVPTAGQIASATLSSGRRFVTANKALMRDSGPELAALAHRHRASGATLDFEAAVGGGVPIVRLLRESMAGHVIDSVRGVLSGSANYILWRMEQGESFAESLSCAQERGLTEADPSRDLQGVDAADKIAVLAWLAFGVHPRTIDVRLRGLPDDPRDLTSAARSRNSVARLAAHASHVNGKLDVAVGPEIVDRTHPFGRTTEDQVAITVVSRSAGQICLSGRGAGGAATASALLADIVRAAAPIPVLLPTELSYANFQLQT